VNYPFKDTVQEDLTLLDPIVRAEESVPAFSYWETEIRWICHEFSPSPHEMEINVMCVCVCFI